MIESGSPSPTRVPVTTGTRPFVLLGDPVEHSLSPLIQNVAFAEAGMDGVYVALPCADEDLPALMRTISGAGGGGNVTLPHKERAATVVDVPSDAVRRTGACNTFWGVDGKIHGDNSDVEGFRRALHEFLADSSAEFLEESAAESSENSAAESAEGLRVLLLGAGGAARAILVGLLDEGVAEVMILNRTVERARAVARRIGGERVRVADGSEEVRNERFDLVVNATRLGLSDQDPLPLDLDVLGSAGALMDVVYGEDGTPLVREALARGIPATDGGEMLVRQGAVAFERWWDVRAPVAAMRAALDRSRPPVGR